MEEDPLIAILLEPATVIRPVPETIRLGAAKKPLLSESETFATYLSSQFEDFYASNYDLEATYFTMIFKGRTREAYWGRYVYWSHGIFTYLHKNYCGTKAYQEYTRLKNSNMSKKSTRKKTDPQSSRMEPVNALDHLDPSLFKPTSSFHQAPKLTKKQLTAENNKKKAAAKREMKQVQKVVNEQKKKENAKEKKAAQLKKQQADEMNKTNRK
ncbi:hypothetical protein KEM48_010708 [Puccinia striiformis f. sp. tritici PST-130]|uniref:Uncharacterized protein n=2 Tax=Puccinia striiformis f. sp. tritici TaxID=168172 RepID=A0A0L0VY91_9BASI|nr:hypothetical protein KEM48_010708 [Puccinia striiformis f. sp. tritici PST-130]KNF03955.1 hypothetical protein PSTG_03040 [Puccinia striiformis f. sp. tritici PST-78]